MTLPPASGSPFRYEALELDPAAATVTCRYALGPHRFAETFTFEPGGAWDDPAVAAAARLLYLVAGVSYYKTAAPPVVDLGELATTADERAFVRTFYQRGLAEFAHRNGLDLSGLAVTGPDLGVPPPVAAGAPGGDGDRPLVPFGGGIDSIVTAEAVRAAGPGAALFVVSRPGDRFEAIEAPAALTGMPVRRAGRTVDPQVLRSAELGFLNGHVPVTGILSAVTVVAAALEGRRVVVMANERSASAANLVTGGHPVNHQWSKSLEFERAFRARLAAAGPGMADYFSWLRPCSELWVARRFAALPRYLPVFRSCNRAFTLDRARRLDHWCGRCDKCCFIDLVLAPFVAAGELAAVFGGHEPLADPSLLPQFRVLLDLTGEPKPFECVGDPAECRAAAVLAAGRPDRAGSAVLAELAAAAAGAGTGPEEAAGQLRPAGPHCIPDRYRPDDVSPGDRTPADQLV